MSWFPERQSNVVIYRRYKSTFPVCLENQPERNITRELLAGREKFGHGLGRTSCHTKEQPKGEVTVTAAALSFPGRLIGCTNKLLQGLPSEITIFGEVSHHGKVRRRGRLGEGKRERFT